MVAQGESAAEKFLLRWRGEARSEAREGDRHVLDLHGGARPQRLDLHREDHRLDGRGHRGGHVRSGGCALPVRFHGGAPARVLPMLDEVARTHDPEGYVQGLLERHQRIMGFGHRVYRAEDPRARLLRRTAQELGSPRFEVAEELERVALAALREYKPDRPLETNVEFWSAVVLDVADIPHDLTPAMFACARVAGWSAHILEEKRTGRLIRPSAQYVGPAERPA